MIQKDLVFVLRLLKRNPLILAVNVVALGVALTMVMLTITYIRFEMSYDNHFTTRQRVVRLYSRVTDNTSSKYYGISLRSAYTQLPARVPEVESAVQLYGGWPAAVRYQQTRPGNATVFYSDKEFFGVFGLPLQLGDAGTALMEKNSAVVTASLARKLFGTLNCLGKSLDADGQKVRVTGVMDDMPRNSHLVFDMLISLSTLNMDWFGGLEFQTYYLLHEHTAAKEAAGKIATVNDALMKDWAGNMNAKVKSGIEPLGDLYLHSLASPFIPNHGSPGQMLIVGLIALFVLLTALLSYISLFIIQGEKRIAEICTRKLFGATNAGVARLFFLETALVFFLSAGLAFLATIRLMPGISRLLLSKVEVSDLFSGWGMLTVSLVLLVLLALTSGYPVIYLSRMKYVYGLRGKRSGAGRRSLFSIASVFIQFLVTSFFISCVVIILSQVKFMHDLPPGFDRSNILVAGNCSSPIARNYRGIREELLKLPFVQAVCGGEHMMGGGCSGQIIRNMWESETSNKGINEYREMPGFGELMKLQLIDGRFFRASMADSHALVVNEAAVRLLGLAPKAGQFVMYNDVRTEIIGVVKDFFYESNPGEPIEPLVISRCFWGTPNIYIRTAGPLSGDQLRRIKTVFTSFDKEYVFDPTTVADIFDGMYKRENRLVKMVGIGAAEVVLISLISLFALTVLKISRRTKEIGIRKVNGSPAARIVTELLRETAIVVVVASLIASLAGYMVMTRWLSDYSARIRLTPGYFVVSLAFVLA
ncbi:MAG TPA: ABC transporter permease, partial [Bacteroidales bacterium]|nr:ABC transporter permease [Bacteroidales bacterium]